MAIPTSCILSTKLPNSLRDHFWIQFKPIQELMHRNLVSHTVGSSRKEKRSIHVSQSTHGHKKTHEFKLNLGLRLVIGTWLVKNWTILETSLLWVHLIVSRVTLYEKLELDYLASTRRWACEELFWNQLVTYISRTWTNRYWWLGSYYTLHTLSTRHSMPKFPIKYPMHQHRKNMHESQTPCVSPMEQSNKISTKYD